MNLLFVTQKVDARDPVLGFVHHWLEIFASRFEHVTVICLEEGTHSLPKNVRVVSLGKERVQSLSGVRYWISRVGFAFRFLKLVFGMGRRDEAVFVHMNPEYVALAGWWWKLKRRIVLLRYNHRAGGMWLRAAAPWATRILYTSDYAYSAHYPNAFKLPAGVDTEIFKSSGAARAPDSIVCLGRISPVKKVEFIIDAALQLAERGHAFHLHLYGAPERGDARYYEAMVHRADRLVRSGRATFHSAVAPDATVQIYNSHEIFVNATPRGSFDKTILEAMACGMVVVCANPSFVGMVPDEFIANEDDAESLAEKLEYALSLSATEKAEYARDLRGEVVKHHSLEKMVDSVLFLFK